MTDNGHDAAIKDATPDRWDAQIAAYAGAPFFIGQAALDR